MKSPAHSKAPIVNAMTVDVEDYFQVSAFENTVSRSQWDAFESRVSRNTERLLALFDHANVRATFFVLGWVAERFPGLVQDPLRGNRDGARPDFRLPNVDIPTISRPREPAPIFMGGPCWGVAKR